MTEKTVATVEFKPGDHVRFKIKPASEDWAYGVVVDGTIIRGRLNKVRQTSPVLDRRPEDPEVFRQPFVKQTVHLK